MNMDRADAPSIDEPAAGTRAASAARAGDAAAPADALACKIAAAAVEEFLALSRVPRPSGHCEAIRSYLQRWAGDHGLRCGGDGGNVWIDAPAAPGFEDSPKVIVQAHMDMVCVADPGVEIDFATQPVEVVRTGDLLGARGTTLGADDGAGLAFGLALAACGEGHGPLRVLATYDEETTMAGAESLAAAALDADYLVNIDNDVMGEVVVSSAGVLEGCFRATFPTAPVDAAAEALLDVALEGFAGGHSGGEIHRGLVNAVDALADALGEASSCDRGAPGVPLRVVCLAGGSAANAIPAQAHARIAVPAGLCEEARTCLEAALGRLVDSHPAEAGRVAVVPCDCARTGCAAAEGALTVEATERVLGLVRSLPRGVLAMSPVVEGLVQTSNNLGLARVERGVASFAVAARSCEDGDMERLHARFDALAAAHGMVFAEPATIPAWPARADNRLCDLMLEGFERAGVAPRRTAVHGGLEPSWFCRTKPGLQMVSCGPSSWGCHSTGETMDVGSFPTFAAALLHALRGL